MERTKIEWCDSTWNPVTGCYNDCEYCYARKIANRYKGFDGMVDNPAVKTVILTSPLHITAKTGEVRKAPYPYGFKPTMHCYRINDPETKGFGKNIFVCSMADLFGDWIPDEWILKVFQSCLNAPNHRYLFLTKNPERYDKLKEKGLLPNDPIFWYGSTVTTQANTVFDSEEHQTFVSIEPLLEPLDSSYASCLVNSHVDWVIFGAETGNRKDKVVPERNWFESSVAVLRDNGVAVMMKDSLQTIWGEPLITEFPWEVKA